MVDRPLEPNMVITVEPGLYFNDVYIRIWSQYPGFAKYFNMEQLQRYHPVGGVRIEDSVLITLTGCENLTTAPKSPEEIEAVMAVAVSSSIPPPFSYTNINTAMTHWPGISESPMVSSPLLSGSNHCDNDNTSNIQVGYRQRQPRASSSFSTTTTDTSTTVLPTPASSPSNHSYCFSEE